MLARAMMEATRAERRPESGNAIIIHGIDQQCKRYLHLYLANLRVQPRGRR